jgi:hypothetical protein
MLVGGLTEMWEGILAPIVVLAVVVIAVGFLLLASRLSWAAREFVVTCRERQRANDRLLEIVQEHLERGEPSLDLDQIWSASAALGSC